MGQPNAGGVGQGATPEGVHASLLAQLERRARDLAQAKRWLDAERIYVELGRLEPMNGAPFHNLGVCQLHQGRIHEAAQSHWNAAIRTPERTDFWVAFGELFRRLRFNEWNAELQHMAVACLTHPGLDPAPYRAVAGSIARVSPTLSPFLRHGSEELSVTQLRTLAEDPLLEALLQNSVPPDLSFERLAGRIRSSLLMALGDVEEPGPLLSLASSVAMQSHLTNYLLGVDPAEATRVDELALIVSKAAPALDGSPEDPPTALTWAVLASYRPLHTLARRNLAEVEPEELGLGGLGDFWSRLVVEPALAEAMSQVVPRLSAPEPGASTAVALQYEAHPYPRWLRVDRGPVEPPSSALPRTLPGLGQDRPEWLKAPRVLIAGCGTGKQALDVARRFDAAEVVAIDLSRASLGYAATGAWKVGEDRIRFLQADILTLDEWGERFDVVEAGGVLHHLADPVEGWRVLLGLLKPGGLMKVGLYSRRARLPVAQARAALAGAGFDETPDAIREGRLWLGRHLDAEAYATIAAWRDFYSLDECRDLLFHTQERSYDLNEIGQILSDLELSFLGFEGLETEALQAFTRRFAPDRILDLQAWDEVEQGQPGTFKGMYQFWVRQNR